MKGRAGDERRKVKGIAAARKEAGDVCYDVS